MTRPHSLPATSNRTHGELLPPEFDLDVVSTFFGNSEDVLAEHFPDVARGTPTPLMSRELPNDDALETDGESAGPLGGAAKPEFSGGGKNKNNGDTSGDGDTGGGGKGNGNGKGKVKDTTPDEPEEPPVVEPSNPPAEDPPGETGGDPAEPEGTGGTDEPDAPADPSQDVYVSGLDTPDGYNVEVIFKGEWTDAQKLGVTSAAEMISDLIKGDLAAHNGIDDFRIEASITSIDGSSGAYAWGGYTSVRTASYLPSEGYIRFDTADMVAIENYGLMEDFAFHEILHAMGFGTGWASMGLVESFNGDLRFTGENATQVYISEFSGIAAGDALSAVGVPVETEGGTGTAGVHWDHDTFGNEIMTGSLTISGNVISDMTVAALEDMGYQTALSDEFIFA